MWVAGFSLFVLGIIFVIVAPINKRSNSRRSAQTKGTLEKSFETENSHGSNGHRYIYSYSVDGIEYKLRSTVRSTEAAKVGDSCTIWYNPKKPKDAQPFHYESTKVYNILIVVGIVMVLVGLVLAVIGTGR